MANAIYDFGREGFGNAAVNWPSDTIKAILVDTGAYTFSQAHDFLDDVPSGARIATVTLASKTNALGVMDAADATFSAVTGASVEAIVIYKDTGTEATSRLLLYIDTVSSGLPVTPNGGNINVTWDNGANKIFKL